MSRTEEIYKPALEGKMIPILTLDNKWHQLFDRTQSNRKIMALEKEVNNILRRQGKLNTESRDIKKLKTKMMDEIMSSMEALQGGEPDKKTNKKLEDNRRLINDCNSKLEAYKNELDIIPGELERVNYQLMLATMEACYETIQKNTREIDSISEWVKVMRQELKKRLVTKQEKEQINQELYYYMHDIFGAEVIEIFDMKYNPEKLREAKKSLARKKTIDAALKEQEDKKRKKDWDEE